MTAFMTDMMGNPIPQSTIHPTTPDHFLGQPDEMSFDPSQEEEGFDWVSGAGLFAKTLGHVMTGISQSDRFKHNAFLAEQELLDLGMAGNQKLKESRKVQRNLLARQVAVTAASGRSYGGSALDVEARSERAFLEEQNIINHNKLLGIAAKENEADMARTNAKVAMVQGVTKSLTSLLSYKGFHSEAAD